MDRVWRSTECLTVQAVVHCWGTTSCEIGESIFSSRYWVIRDPVAYRERVKTLGASGASLKIRSWQVLEYIKIQTNELYGNVMATFGFYAGFYHTYIHLLIYSTRWLINNSVILKWRSNEVTEGNELLENIRSNGDYYRFLYLDIRKQLINRLSYIRLKFYHKITCDHVQWITQWSNDPMKRVKH